jgi:hypothetical protein
MLENELFSCESAEVEAVLENLHRSSSAHHRIQETQLLSSADKGYVDSLIPSAIACFDSVDHGVSVFYLCQCVRVLTPANRRCADTGVETSCFDRLAGRVLEG